MNNIYGYVRESEKQSEKKQIAAIQEYGVVSSRIYKDKPDAFSAYHLLLGKIRPGDSVVLKSLDCLGYTYEDILSKWQRITKEHEAAIVVLDMPLPDTAGALNGQFLSELVYDVMSYVAQTRQDFKRQKQSEGITAAHLRGVKFGRPSKKDCEEFEKVREAYKRGAISATRAAADLNICRATFRRWVQEEERQEDDVRGEEL